MRSNSFKGRNELSRQLQASEVPRSPRELDDRIVQRAREKAREYKDNSIPVGSKWPENGWRPAIAVFSVAVIAVFVGLQYNGSSRSGQIAVTQTPLEAEIASIQSNESQTTVLTDSQSQPTQRPRLQESLQTRELENDVQTPASPVARNTGATAELALRTEQRQLPSQTDSAAPAFAPVNPGLAELLSDIDRLTAAAQSNQEAVLTESIERLRSILDVVENSFIDSRVEVEAYRQPDSPPTIQQLAEIAGSLLDTYNAVNNNEIREQLESAYRQQRQAYGAVVLPPTLELMLSVLQNWRLNR